MHITTRNVNTALRDVYPVFSHKSACRNQQSRNGFVLSITQPVLITYKKPHERVCYCPVRDCNPFFHLMESIAILRGFNAVGFLSYFNSNISNYSDDGVTFNAFYGTRMVHDFCVDQLQGCIEVLKKDLDSRQAVIQLWDPTDLLKDTKDKACNTTVYFRLQDSALDMTVCNRSNDAIWGGVTGANTVHFSFIQEYVALALGKRMGEYHHFSNNLHIYTDNRKWLDLKNTYCNGSPPGWFKSKVQDRYRQQTIPLFEHQCEFDNDMDQFFITWLALDSPKPMWSEGYETEFFRMVVIPMFNAWVLRKNGNKEAARNTIEYCMVGCDWKKAALEWMKRRDG